MKIKDLLLEYINDENNKALKAEELAKVFEIDKKERKIFYKVLDNLEEEGLVKKSKKKKYMRVTEEDRNLVGTLEGNQKGFAFFLSDNKDFEDVFISKENLNGALNKDRVRIQILDEKSPLDGENSREGKVLEIVERNRDPIVGTYEKSKKFGFFIPEDSSYYRDVFIPKGKENKAKDGYKVVCKIDKFTGKNPEGHIVEVIGDPKDAGVDILSIIKARNLPYIFSKETESQAKKLKEPSIEELASRENLKDLFTVTIDGRDAKDFDDAISIEKKGTKYILYVHIADVSHYVKRKSSIDKEAYERGNSVYLLDRVIPMLPFELSDDLCSLRPNLARLAISLKMEINKDGKVESQEFYKSVIKSDYRLVYDDVSDYLELDKKFEDEKLNKKLTEFSDLYHILKDAKEKRGAIDFNMPESYIELDNLGRPINIRLADRRTANRIIEEFMLIANETVARFFGLMQWPFIYRIHEEPSEEKYREFRRIIAKLGYKIDGKKLYPKDFQKLIHQVQGKDEELMINKLMLTSMTKARYSSERYIHFGLALDYYTHFTSPIRRYSDLTIHRILKFWLDDKEDIENGLFKKLDDIAEQCSFTEIEAQEAEREVDKLKMTEYMRDFIGEEFEGIITSLTNFGIFVQLPNTIEILVAFRNMREDYYTFDEENYIVIGELLRKTFKIGQKVKVRIDSVDIAQREIDGSFID